jgi:hypothetical protein
MARRGDLAGLAALGALGYMLSKGNKAAPTGGGSMPAAAAAAPTEAASEEDPMEAANRRVERTLIPNQRGEAGTSETVFPSNKRPSATTAPSAATGLKNPGTGNQRGPTAAELEAYAASRRGGSGGGRGPRAGEAEAYAANRNVNYGNEGRSRPTAVNTGSVRDIPTGGPAGYSGVRGEKIDSSELGRNVSNTLAAMGPGKLSGVGMVGHELRNADRIRKATMAGEVPAAGREAVTNPLAWMAGPGNKTKFAGDVESAGREAVTNPMAWMAGPKGMAQMNEAGPSMTTKAKETAEAVAARLRKKALSEADTTGGAIGYKRGGAVKKKMASGGMASSASKRADGIATKGKTRGKMY